MRAGIAAVVAVVLAGWGAASVGAQATTKAEPKAEPTYRVTFVVVPDGMEQTYTGTSTFVVDAKGAVTGKMVLTDPVMVRANLSGKMDKGTWTFEYGYDIPDQGCSGLVTGTAKVPDGAKTFSGTAVISGGCSPDPMNGSFTFTLQEK